MQCPSCNANVADDSKFCPDCGAPLPRPCPACGHLNAARSTFCSECGARLLSAKAPAPQSVPDAPDRLRQPRAPSAARSRCCFATWWVRLHSQAVLTLKTFETLFGAITNAAQPSLPSSTEQ